MVSTDNILDFDAEIFRSRCPDLEVVVNTARQEKGEMGMRSQTAHNAVSITLSSHIFTHHKHTKSCHKYTKS